MMAKPIKTLEMRYPVIPNLALVVYLVRSWIELKFHAIIELECAP